MWRNLRAASLGKLQFSQLQSCCHSLRQAFSVNHSSCPSSASSSREHKEPFFPFPVRKQHRKVTEQHWVRALRHSKFLRLPGILGTSYGNKLLSIISQPGENLEQLKIQPLHLRCLHTANYCLWPPHPPLSVHIHTQGRWGLAPVHKVRTRDSTQSRLWWALHANLRIKLGIL